MKMWLVNLFGKGKFRLLAALVTICVAVAVFFVANSPKSLDSATTACGVELFAVIDESQKTPTLNLSIQDENYESTGLDTVDQLCILKQLNAPEYVISKVTFLAENPHEADPAGDWADWQGYRAMWHLNINYKVDLVVWKK